jgi:hypothetical protein
MRRFLAATVVATAAALWPATQPAHAQPGPAPAPAAATQPAAQVPVRAVVLFSSGVGYFEHYGSVDGNASTELRFKTQQINDILKSLVLQDLDGGHVAAVTYPSQSPLARTLRSFEVDLSANPSLGELLNQLRGAKVKVSLQGEEVAGTILGLEKKQRSTGKDTTPVEVWVLNLIAGGTIRAVELDQVQKLELEDPDLQKELHEALLALSQARDQDKKPVTINFVGQGQRHVRLGYVVETPVWKTSYRLLLDAADEKKGDEGKPATNPGQSKATLQGWAIVENQTDNDWNNVEMSLVSGRPISFIEDLYQPLYVPRPTVQPELYASLSPQTYEGGMQKQEQEALAFQGQAKGMDGVPMAAAAPAAPAMAMVRQRSMHAEFAGRDAAEDRPMNAAASVSSVASASKIGELFQYTVGSVSLPRQRSAMIPIINDAVQVEKLSIYNQSVLARNPLNGARMKNTTDKHLLQGPVTVFDGGSYAGDASIDNVPPGQTRLLSYGVDLEMLVDATRNTNTSTIESGKIVKGILWLSRRDVYSQEYLADNKGKTDKTLLIEHPIRPGWKLVEGIGEPKPVETTEAVYRFEGHVPAGKQSKLTVKQQVVQAEQIAILPTDVGQLEYYAKTGQIDDKVKSVLAKAISLKNAMTDTERQLNESTQKSRATATEQERIRKNMTVSQSTQYYNRLLAKLNDQETQLEQLQQDQDALRKKLDGQRKELEDYLNGTTVNP